jgi:iron complex transport system ATP-binding protein
MRFETAGLSFRYPGAQRPALDDVSVGVAAGTFYGVIGPNGSGKSTLVRVLLGLLRPESGAVRFDGQLVARWSRRALAQRVGVVAQDEEMVFPVAVRALVTMGRYPHLGAWQPLRREDHEAVDRAMARCEVTEFAERPIATLSGGERQRARLARALAQEPQAYALDEPTAALDIAHEMTIFELLARLVRADGATVLVVTHNLNLAARYADRLLLLDRGRVVAEGTPSAVLTRERVEQVWGWPVRIATHAGPGPDTGAPQVVALASNVDGTPFTSTRNSDA